MMCDICYKILQQRKQHGIFHGSPVIRKLPSITGDVGSIPGPGTKISHASGQLSLHAATRSLCKPQRRSSIAK